MSLLLTWSAVGILWPVVGPFAALGVVIVLVRFDRLKLGTVAQATS